MLPSIILGVFTFTTIVLFMLSRSGYVFWFLHSHEDMFIVHIINFAFLAAAIVYYAIKQPRRYMFNSKERGDILRGYDEYEKKLSSMMQHIKTLVVSDEQFITLVDGKPILFSDLSQIAHLGKFEEGCTVTVRSEGNAGYSIEARISRIDDTSIRLEIV